MGLPLNSRQIAEYCDHLLREKRGQGFPGVGKRWVGRFVIWHSDELWTKWTSPLDKNRANGLNPTAVKEYFDAYKKIMDEHHIAPTHQFALDETGLMLGCGAKHKVVSGTTSQSQHEIRGGNRENVTVVPVICADGTSLRPLVIFKGKKIWSLWSEDNPLDAL